MKKKGFTLIELLAVIVILGVIMIIAIPSVTSYITNARKDSYISDAKMFVNATKTKLTADATLPQGTDEEIKVPISDIALDKGGEKSPYGNNWDYANSYVIVKNIGTSSDPEYVWQVTLNDTKGNCIPLTAMNDLRRELVTTGCYTDGGNHTYEEGTLIAEITKDAVMDNVSSTYVSSATGIDFNEISSDTNGKGIYIRKGTENKEYPIYYFRGNIDNNYVVFADLCWKIVRTTETGGIKIIYSSAVEDDGTCGESSIPIGAIKFNTERYDNISFGYMYGTKRSTTYEATHTNTNNSQIKTNVDNWYEDFVKYLQSNLEDTVWCNDRQIAEYKGILGPGYGDNTTYYSAYIRLGGDNKEFDVKPTFDCAQPNDRFTVSTENGNGALKYPTGILTADEVVFAGMSLNEESITFLPKGWWWLSTPLYYEQYNGGVGTSVFATTMLDKSAVTNPNGDFGIGAYPVISLKEGTKITGGDGTASTPYVVE